jgi:hypothetical protein
MRPRRSLEPARDVAAEAGHAQHHHPARDKHGSGVHFVEIFSWKDDKSSSIAHESPEVMAIQEPMGPILEGGPSPQLAVVDRIAG